MNWLEKRRVSKYLASLSLEEKQKLKSHLAGIGKYHCLHGVKYTSDIPCIKCMTENVTEGNLSKIISFV